MSYTLGDNGNVRFVGDSILSEHDFANAVESLCLRDRSVHLDRGSRRRLMRHYRSIEGATAEEIELTSGSINDFVVFNGIKASRQKTPLTDGQKCNLYGHLKARMF